MPITHEAQKAKWNEEHRAPLALRQMDAKKLSSGVRPFLEFLERQNKRGLIGLEMGCGKGRNVVGLAQSAVMGKMYGFDFSEVAVAEARRRAEEAGVSAKVRFDAVDATENWPHESDFFDFGLDCFASTDIEDPAKRQYAAGEMRRVLKPGGFFFLYVMSDDDEYHKKMVRESPAEEAGSFYNPGNGKFEKVFSEEELDRMYSAYELVEARRIEKTAEFFGKSYYCKHHWRIYRK